MNRSLLLLAVTGWLLLPGRVSAQWYPLRDKSNVSIRPVAVDPNGGSTTSRVFEELDMVTDSLRVGDTLRITLRQIRNVPQLRLVVTYCHGNCAPDPNAGRKVTGYEEVSLLTPVNDTEFSLTLPIQPQSTYKDAADRVQYLDNSQLRRIFIGVANPSRVGTARYNLLISVARLRRPGADYPFPEKKEPPTLKTARTTALLVGISDYDDAAIRLQRPAVDVARLDSVLTERYVVSQVIRLPNATKKALKDTLMALSYRMTNDDNLLLYFAGHATDVRNAGYWALKDSRTGDLDSFLSNASLISLLNDIHAQHMLLIVDACFGSTLLQGISYTDQRPQTWESLYTSKSRRVISSSLREEVPDKSVFIDYLVRKLLDNDEPYLTSEELFSSLKFVVHNRSSNQQRPAYGNIYGLSTGTGDFLFQRRATKNQ